VPPFVGLSNQFYISPLRSELRGIIKDEKYIADCNKEEIKQKLENLITLYLKLKRSSLWGLF
jgi:hypothetical protein